MTAASGAFAQVTLDLDVLSDLPDTPPPPKKQRKVRLTEPKKDKTSARKKNETARKDSGSKTQKQQQQAQPKRRPAETETSSVKYQVRESARQDEHDKLKPRANPVPVVKVLKSTSTEPAKTETAAAETSDRPQTENAGRSAEKTVVTGTGVITPFAADGTIAADILHRSVYPVEGKLGRKGRSIMLSREIPAESATAKAIGRGLLLYDIFLFEDRSSDLTDEMSIELVAVAEELRKAPKRRVLLLSYSGTTTPERGRERQLSLRRALAVRTALTQLGIRSLRIELRSQGQKGAGEKMPNRVDILFDD